MKCLETHTTHIGGRVRKKSTEAGLGVSLNITIRSKEEVLEGGAKVHAESGLPKKSGEECKKLHLIKGGRSSEEEGGGGDRIRGRLYLV